MKARHSLMRITSVSSSSFDIPAGRRCENKFHSPRENSRESSIVREKRKGERLIFLESINSFSSRAYIFIKKKIEAYKISILVRSRRKKNYRKKEIIEIISRNERIIEKVKNRFFVSFLFSSFPREKKYIFSNREA